MEIGSLSYRDVARTIDHALLRPELTPADAAAGVALGRRYDVAAVCVRPCDVARAREALAGSSTEVCTVVGFPHGSSTTATKVAESQQAIAEGAGELDVVLNVGWLRAGLVDDVRDELAAVVAAARQAHAIVKVILETAYLDDDQKRAGCLAAEAAGAHFVKTSTGYPATATVEDVRLLREAASPALQVEAAGGIRTLDALLALASAGASRFGTSATVAILDELSSRLRAAEEQAATR
jgi:deoxyribose-phosphate aldolase